MSYQWKIEAPFPEKLRGVKTYLRQELDFGALDEAEFKRVLNAAKRGYTARSGYVRELVICAAKHIGATGPVCISPGWSGGTSVTVDSIPTYMGEAVFAELMAQSDVQHQLWCARRGATDRWGTDRSQRKSEFKEYSWAHSHYLVLHGWQGRGAACRKQISKVLLSVPRYRDDMAKLAAFIETKPVFSEERSIG